MKRYDPQNLKIGQAVELWLKCGDLYNENDSSPTYQRSIGIVINSQPYDIWVDFGTDIIRAVPFDLIAFFISYTVDS